MQNLWNRKHRFPWCNNSLVALPEPRSPAEELEAVGQIELFVN